MDTFYMLIWFTGRVQGVGFRYQTTKVAQEFEVCGSVKNLDDGRVYLEVEGQEAEVQAFKDELESQMANFIRDTEVKSGFRPQKMRGFCIG